MGNIEITGILKIRIYGILCLIFSTYSTGYANVEKEKAEIVVRSPEEISNEGKWEIYGDTISGLRIQKLEKVLEEDSTQRFVPF